MHYACAVVICRGRFLVEKPAAHLAPPARREDVVEHIHAPNNVYALVEHDTVRALQPYRLPLLPYAPACPP